MGQYSSNFSLKYLLDGGSDTRYDEINNLFTNIIRDTNLYKLLDSWYIGTSVQQDAIFNDNSGKITEFLLIFFLF